jgi:hypothetical protein
LKSFQTSFHFACILQIVRMDAPRMERLFFCATGKECFIIMKIVVLAGGLSTERAVSLVTGTAVCRALRENGHQAILVDLFLGIPELPQIPASIFDASDGLCPEAKIETEAPDLAAVRASRGGRSLIGPNVLELCQMADIVFLGLHGMDGEDGRIQATLDLLDVPYTGSGHLASAVAMDKVVTKRMMDSLGIPTPEWQAAYLQARGRGRTGTGTSHAVRCEDGGRRFLSGRLFARHTGGTAGRSGKRVKIRQPRAGGEAGLRP